MKEDGVSHGALASRRPVLRVPRSTLRMATGDPFALGGCLHFVGREIRPAGRQRSTMQAAHIPHASCNHARITSTG